MKWQSVLILMAIVVHIAVPPAFPLPVSGSGVTEIGAFNFCHKAPHAVSFHGDMQYLTVATCRCIPFSGNDILEFYEFPLKQPFLAFQEERPPEPVDPDRYGSGDERHHDCLSA